MKRLIFGSTLVCASAFVACADEAPAPVNNATGGSAPASGAGGTSQAGTSTTGGASGSGLGGTGGAATATGGTGGATAGAPTGGSSGASTGGGSGAATGGAAGSASGSAGQSAGSGGASGSGTGAVSGGGMGGSAGSPGGTGGGAGMVTAGTGNGGMAGSGEDLMAVAAPLNGQTILMPCDNDTETRVCIPRADTTKPCTGTGTSYAGTHSFNEQITLGGEAGVRYVLTLRIRGLTEAKTYTGGTDRSSSGTQVPADGLYTGGQADNSGNGYNIYFIRTDSPSQYYYLNSIGVGTDTRIRHSVFESDYQFDLPVDGGSTVCLVSADPNTSAIKNCQDPDVSSVCNGVSLPSVDSSTSAAIGSQPYNGQFVGISVVSVKRM
jgi:hypothetical protein